MSKRIKMTALCMAAILIFGLIPLYVSGAAPGATEIEKRIDALINYSDGSADFYKELSAADLLRSAAGVTVTSAEKEYLSICEITFKYNDNVLARSVLCKKTESGFLITASRYSYNAQNGATVSWIPVSVTVDGVTKTFSDDRYEAVFTGMTEGETYEILTSYKTQITVPQSTLTTLANAGYDEGRRVIEERKAYNDAIAAYERNMDNYEKEYAAYLVKNNEYTAYLNALARYNAEKAEYDAYVAAKEQYERDYAAWLSYLEAHEKYEKDLADFEEKNAVYEEQYKLYAESYAALSACRKSMEVMESVFTTVYGTLKSDTVATVVARKGELVEYGVNETDIDNAGGATERLISVLTPYNGLKSERDRFYYYQANYREIRSQFVRLYAALHSLANNALVRMELQKRGKLDRYYQFVAQLYTISTGLDDDVTYSDSWNVRGNNADDVLDGSQTVTDRNSSNPEGLVYPENCELPEAPVRPEEPEKVDKPQFTYAGEVTEPSGPPAAVDKPVEPKKPADVPDAPVFTAQQLLLETGVKNGTLKQRTVNVSHTLTFETSVSHMTVYSAYVFVSFYDYDHKTLLYSEKARVGSDVPYKGKTPAREADVKNTYAFSGWIDEDGKPASFTNIEDDCAFYASYTATPVMYNVTFFLHGEQISKKFTYGDRPICPKEVTSYIENGKEYIFDGWSPALALVTCDIAYTARYRELDGKFTVSFNVHGAQSDYRFAAGDMPTPPETPERFVDGLYFYEFSGWSPEITKVTENIVYTAEYSTEIAVPTERGTGAEVSESAFYLFVDCTGKGMADYSKIVSYAKETGKGVAFISGEATVWIAPGDLAYLDCAERFEVSCGTDKQLDLVFKTAGGDTPSLDLTVPVSFEGKDTSTARVFEKSADGLKEIAFVIKDGAFLLHMTGSDTYLIAFSYVIQTESIGGGYLKTNLKTAEKGETVVITVQPDLGATLNELYMTVNGEKTVLKANTFVMPDGDVTVTAVFEKTGYVIVFLDDQGNEISKQLCSYGEMPAVPDDPKKEGDENTVYAFSGWDPEVMPAAADVEYRPVFKAGAREGGEDYQTSPQTGFFTKVLPKISIVLLSAGALAAVIVVFARTIVKIKRKKV